jgi:uncharacterized integral membrane protein
LRKLLNLFFVVPVAIVLIFLSVANRHWVTFSLDPLNTEAPAFAISLPFFVFIFATLIIGALIGACLTWFSQGKHRKALREQSYETSRLRREYEKDHPAENKQTTEIAPGLPLISSN